MPFIESSTAALVRFGPGGDFVTDLREGADGRLTRSSPTPTENADGFGEDSGGSGGGWGFSLLRRRPALGQPTPVRARASELDQVHMSELEDKLYS